MPSHPIFDPGLIPAKDPVSSLIERAIALFERGESLFREGRLEEARNTFRESLESLRNSGYDFFANPRLERTYYSVLNDVQALELETLIDPAEMQVSLPESSPLDELGRLNLFTIEVDPHLTELVSEDLLKTRFGIPVVLNDAVLRFLNYYENRGRNYMELGLKRSGRYLDLFREVFEREGLPLDLIYVPYVESLFNPRAYSRARAKGLWQFVKWTAISHGLRQDSWIDERSDVLKSTEAAARYLKQLFTAFGDWHLALAAYNVGPGRIERILERHGSMDYWTMVKRGLLPRETDNFVPSILAALIIFRNPARYGFAVEPEPEIEFEVLPVPSQVDLAVAAELIDVPVETLAELNPELRRGITPKDYPDYVLKVPPGRAQMLKDKLATLPEKKRVVYQQHRVRRGETLSDIAEKYSVPVSAIAQANGIRNVHRLSLGQELIIPVSERASRWLALAPSRSAGYVVRKGDSLERIARIYGVTVLDLIRWNGLKLNSTIYPGQRIRVVAEASSAEKSIEGEH